MTKLLNHYLQITSVWSVVIPACLGLFYYSKLSTSAKIIWGMTVFAIIPQMIKYINNIDSVLLLSYNCYIAIEFIFASFFFLTITPDRPLVKKIFGLILPLFISYFLFLSFKRGISQYFFNELVLLVNIYEIGLVLLYFYQTYNIGDEIFKKESSVKFFLLGMLLYAPTTLTVFAFWHYLHLKTLNNVSNFHIINNLFNTIMYLLYGLGIWVDSNKEI